jgi:type I restriction enzyme R subunit
VDEIEDDETVLVTPEGEADGNQGVRYYVGDVEVSVAAERVQFLDPESGRLITESIRDYTRNRVTEEYQSLDEFLRAWNAAERKQAVVEELAERGVLFEALSDQVGKDYDPFDLICHVAFDQPPLTRRERAEQVRKRSYFSRYGSQAQAVLEALLDKYANEGLASIEDTKVLRVQPFSNFGTPLELVKAFGGRGEYESALRQLEAELYPAA